MKHFEKYREHVRLKHLLRKKTNIDICRMYRCLALNVGVIPTTYKFEPCHDIYINILMDMARTVSATAHNNILELQNIISRIGNANIEETDNYIKIRMILYLIAETHVLAESVVNNYETLQSTLGIYRYSSVIYPERHEELLLFAILWSSSKDTLIRRITLGSIRLPPVIMSEHSLYDLTREELEDPKNVDIICKNIIDANFPCKHYTTRLLSMLTTTSIFPFFAIFISIPKVSDEYFETLTNPQKLYLRGGNGVACDEKEALIYREIRLTMETNELKPCEVDEYTRRIAEVQTCYYWESIIKQKIVRVMSLSY